jgi:hypothetical protein
MVTGNMTAFIEKIFGDEGAQRRMAMIAAMPNSYHRIMSCHVSRLSDWDDAAPQRYPIKTTRPRLKLIELPVPERDDDDEVDGGPETPKSHQSMRVQSVIDAHAWDRAEWKGTGFLEFRGLPGIALMFKDEVAAKKIFERWQERFGSDDTKEEILLAIIRNLPGQDPNFYIVMVTSKWPEADERDPKQSVIVSTRSMTMTPPNSTNLGKFLASYDATGEFYLMPAVASSQGPPTMFHELAILKRAISVKSAKDIGPNDVEGLALRLRSLDEGDGN